MNKLLPVFAIAISVFFVGCEQPIYKSTIATLPNIQLISDGDPSRYEWPLSEDDYIVTKPPQMAYLTAFSEKIKRTDPITAEVVPWSNEGITEGMQEFLQVGYLISPDDAELTTVVRLKKDDYHGSQAFDVSSDGSRLVLIDDQGLAMYRADTGALVGHMKLPKQIVADGKAHAIRFVGNSKDMLVATERNLYRISSEDGSLTGRIAGCGEPIVQWDVNPAGDAMLVRSESGRLFGGDPNLELFSAYSFGKDLRFDAASLSTDGTRIGVVVDNIARIYSQENSQILGHESLDTVTLDPGAISIAMGISSDVFADGDGILYKTTATYGERGSGVYHMMWKPLMVSVTSREESQNSLLVVGQRFVDGKEELVLFDFGPIGRANSAPSRLDELPTRVAHSRSGGVVAIEDSKGLRLVQREVWLSTGLAIHNNEIRQWVHDGKFDELERLLKIIRSQQRMAYGRTPAELETLFLEAISERWTYLENKDPNGKELRRFRAWRKKESQLSLVANGLHLYGQAWDARGSGTAMTITEEGGRTYDQKLSECANTLDRAIEMGNAPLCAFNIRVQAELEQSGDLSAVDKFCEQAVRLYPGELAPHQSISFKLTPRWFGERGDVLSYVLSVSKLLDGSDSDLLYARLLGNACSFVDPRDQYEWNGFAREKMVRGLKEIVRRQSFDENQLWNLYYTMGVRNDTLALDQIVPQILKYSAAPSPNLRQFEELLYRLSQKLRTK